MVKVNVIFHILYELFIIICFAEIEYDIYD